MLIAIGVLCSGVWLLAQHDVPLGHWSPDGYEYADVARRLSRGDGFTTGVVFPAQLHFGVADHPSLTRPPLWPMLLAAVFRLAGPNAEAVHGTMGVLFVATAVLAAGLATGIGGLAAGLVTGLSIAASPGLRVLSLGALSEPLFGFCVLLAFALWRFGAGGFWIGASCGLAYLTRYNGALLLPLMLALLATRAERRRALLLGSVGFAVLVVPWWIRNALVAGDPFYSLLNYNPYMAPGMHGLHSSLIYFLDPDLESAVAIAPWEKFSRNLPLLLRYFPLASANLAAFVGVVWACARGSKTGWAFAAFAVATTLVAALALPLGRYYVPLLPLLFAIGAASWVRFGGRLAVPALALILAAPWLPRFPAEAPDLSMARSELTAVREQMRADPARGRLQEVRRAALERCIAPGAVVLAEKAPRVAWLTDATAVYLPASDEDLWTIVEGEPISFVQITRWQDTDRQRFDATFTPRPDCAPDLYARRGGTNVR
jgi:4-amino-4-deoxy-L-arabinose transferase-like glycosyltransferase